MRKEISIIAFMVIIILTSYSFAGDTNYKSIDDDLFEIEYEYIHGNTRLITKNHDNEVGKFLVKFDELLVNGQLQLFEKKLKESYLENKSFFMYRTYRVVLDKNKLLSEPDTYVNNFINQLKVLWLVPYNDSSGKVMKFAKLIEVNEDEIAEGVATLSNPYPYNFFFDREEINAILLDNNQASIRELKRIDLVGYGLILYFEVEDIAYCIPMFHFPDEYGIENHRVIEIRELIKCISKKRKSDTIVVSIIEHLDIIIGILIVICIFLIIIYRKGKSRNSIG